MSVTVARPLAGRSPSAEVPSQDGRAVGSPWPASARDLLAVPVAGAYQLSMASSYNLVGRPAVVAVRDGRARQLIRRETVEDFLSREVGRQPGSRARVASRAARPGCAKPPLWYTGT